jgi:hypothetical protein
LQGFVLVRNVGEAYDVYVVFRGSRSGMLARRNAAKTDKLNDFLSVVLHGRGNSDW